MNGEFKPYVSADKNPRELTITSIVTGILLAAVFGAANAYLGLRVGLTISASIPAAVISMGVIRKLLHRDSILESNMVQTIGSAGESVAAGVIFTAPALFLWANEGVVERPAMAAVVVIALCGGILGVMFMIPLRKALIVNGHGSLPYPEGTACADVLLAGEKNGGGAKYVFGGVSIAAVIKFAEDGLKVAKSVMEIPLKPLRTAFSINGGPALVSVGYICGIKVVMTIFSGTLIAWFVIIPLIVLFGGNSIVFPASVTVAELYASGGPAAIWSNYIRYIGAGALSAAGLISLAKSIPSIVKTFASAMKSFGGLSEKSDRRTDRDFSVKIIAVVVILVVLVIFLAPNVPIGFAGALLIAVFGFFFGTVASKMVGLIGSSNNPISGMTIATLLITTLLFRVTGNSGTAGMVSSLAIGMCICVIVAIAGDTSQDLKTGFLLGATPKKQQLGELIGVLASSLSIGIVLLVLDKAWGFGSAELAAPQATLMKMVVEGVMSGNLPWGLVAMGAFIGIAGMLLGANPLSIAIGMYLPLETTSAMMIGGLLRWTVEKMQDKGKLGKTGNGILVTSGMIAGEGLVGILLAGLAVAKVNLDIGEFASTGAAGGFLLVVLMLLFIARAEHGKKILKGASEN